MKFFLIRLGFAFLLIISSSLKAQDQGLGSPSVQAQFSPTIQLPKFVSVQIVNATIGPSKVDGSKWGGMGKVDPSVTAKLAHVLLDTTAAYTGAIALLAGPMISGSDKPAPFGVVDVAVNNEYDLRLRASLFSSEKEIGRTFTPIFDLPGYKNIPLNDETRFKVTLFSKNRIMKPTPIGVAEINAADLEKALNEEKIYQVPVADQTQNQLLFIGVEVRAEAGGN